MDLADLTWLVWPGAGSNRDHHTLVALESLPCRVRRCNFDYQDEGRRAPDRAPRLLDAVRRAWDAEVAGGTDPASIVLGGRSMGGRICSIAIAEGLPAVGLIALSYPLHPIGKPDRLRIEHFPDLDVPVLFLGGDRDPMCPIDLLTQHAAAIPGKVTIDLLAGQRHDPKGCDDAIVERSGAWLGSLVASR